MLWRVPLGSQSPMSWAMEHWPSCSITPSGRLTLPKWVPLMVVKPRNMGVGS
jgi:hypothetical protein